MRQSVIFALLFAVMAISPTSAQMPGSAASAGNFRIVWEVKNRFRLFRNEADFLRQAAASRADGILATEQRLEIESKGLGWAKDVVGNLCLDPSGNLLDTCERDGERESYLTPKDHRIGVALAGPVAADATCAWSFDEGQGAVKQQNAPCEQEIKLRVPNGKTTVASVDVPLSDGGTQRVIAEIAVRDLLIAGLGDSIAAGEGNPDRAVRLEGGFCFKRFLSGLTSQYFRPSRAGYKGDRSCEAGPATADAAQDWARHGARWMSPGCHRSLYSYQVRTTLALAIEQPHVAVTLVPLACTGANIEAGMFGPQKIDDCPWVLGIDTCSSTSPPQFNLLRDMMAAVHRTEPQRSLDLVLLTIGANDVSFASLVANVIVNAPAERVLLRQGGSIASVEDSQKALDGQLPDEFARVRTALKPYLGGNLGRVVYVSYGNPAMQAPHVPCGGGSDGFDVHPAFSADKERLRAAAEFVDNKFLPKLKALATCDGAKACRDPLTERMTFVDGHQAAFDRHGMCVRAPTDPEFDRQCFSTTGDSFETDPNAAADDPMACQLHASDYPPYAPRGRWIRTANDSYFAAMTYPEGMPAVLKPSDIHDAIWGVLSAVYGGAVHPSAEGYAAMADAALPAARQVLGLQAPPAIHAEPLPPPVPAPVAVPGSAAAPPRAP